MNHLKTNKSGSTLGGIAIGLIAGLSLLFMGLVSNPEDWAHAFGDTAGATDFGIAPAGIDPNGKYRGFSVTTDGLLRINGSFTADPPTNSVTDVMFNNLYNFLQTGTVNVAASFSGGATETNLTGRWTTYMTAFNGYTNDWRTWQTNWSARTPASLGQKAMAASTPVVIASDQSSITIADGGGSITVDGTIAATQSGTWNVNATNTVTVTGTVTVTDGAGALNVIVDSGSITADTELPSAAALADNASNPTVPGVGAFLMGYDGSTWDRVPATSVDGLLVNLGANNDVTVTSGNITEASAAAILTATQGSTNRQATVQTTLDGLTNRVANLEAGMTFLTNGVSASCANTVSGTVFSNLVASASGTCAGFIVGNTNNSVFYVKWKDRSTAAEVGSITPDGWFLVPGLQTNGAGNNVTIPVPGGIKFTSGLYVWATTGPATNDNTAITGVHPIMVLKK